MANIITVFRIVCGFLLLLFPAFSPLFYVFYILGGLTDALDGMIARMLHQTSKLGSRLDTVADLFFIVFVLIKVLSSVYVPLWLWVWIGLIALVKIVNVILGFVCHRRFVVAHTRMNKIAGILLFIVPLSIDNVPWQLNFIIVYITCAVATLAAVHEGYFIRMNKEII